MLWLARADIEPLLDVPSCIAAVEAAFLARGVGQPTQSVAVGLDLPGGGMHAKLARLELSRSVAVAKINANLPDNPRARGLPTVQGVLALFDAITGEPLALMDSAAITTARTAAASAVAAKWLARDDASVITCVGCGVQAYAHVAALREVRAIERVYAVDVDPIAAQRLAADIAAQYDIDVIVTRSLDDAVRESDIVVTATPSRTALLTRAHATPGLFIAAVGADHAHKQEIDGSLLREAAVIVDDLDQCAHMGDLHHALAAGVMRHTDVRAALSDVVAGRIRGRERDDEIVVFDSTGLALEDVAAAWIVYERATGAK